MMFWLKALSEPRNPIRRISSGWLGFFSLKYHHSAITGLDIFVAASAVVVFAEQVWNQ
jgi:hypothetical protein